MAEATLKYRSVVDVFTADGTWYKPPGLAYVVLVLAAGGGAGGTGWAAGGGGGAAVRSKKIPASLLPDVVEVVVGQAGPLASSPTPGGESRFGADFRAPGGMNADGGGEGGISPLRGGDGGRGGADGESVSSLPVQMLAGGGGGGSGSGSWGGISGGNFLVDGTQSGSAGIWSPGVHQCGAGGSQWQPPQWPAGGGGPSQAGAAGSVAVIQVISNIDDIVS